jgi:hypothetical protein
LTSPSKQSLWRKPVFSRFDWMLDALSNTRACSPTRGIYYLAIVEDIVCRTHEHHESEKQQLFLTYFCIKTGVFFQPKNEQSTSNAKEQAYKTNDYVKNKDGAPKNRHKTEASLQLVFGESAVIPS